MTISTDKIKELREQSGAGIMECRNALLEVAGDMDKAIQVLKERGLLKVAKTAGRVTTQGLVEAYVHPGGRIGALVEVNCESDFVARTAEFKELVHNIAMQVAAMCPKYVAKEEIPEGADVNPQEVSLLLQPYIRDPGMTVQDLINGVIAKVGENIRVRRFSRFELGN